MEFRWVVKQVGATGLYWAGDNRWTIGVIAARWFDSYDDAERAALRELPDRRTDLQIVQEVIR